MDTETPAFQMLAPFPNATLLLHFSVFSRTPKGLPSNSTALTSVLSGSLDGSAVELIEMYLRISAFHFYSELKNSNSIST